MATIHTDKSMMYVLYLLVFWIKLEGNRKLAIKVHLYVKIKTLE